MDYLQHLVLTSEYFPKTYLGGVMVEREEICFLLTRNITTTNNFKYSRTQNNNYSEGKWNVGCGFNFVNISKYEENYWERRLKFQAALSHVSLIIIIYCKFQILIYHVHFQLSTTQITILFVKTVSDQRDVMQEWKFINNHCRF